jgi:GH25 family lysozyme M1 (1,4-beta-N-acetylmuramidase)
MTVKYYDVSSYQGQMNVPSDAVAIVAKATEGTYYRDAEYSWFREQAANRKLLFSGYHFLKQETDPAAQAAYFFAFAGNVPCMLDVETSGGSKPTIDQILAFKTALEGLGGHLWGAYVPQWYWSMVGGDLSRLTAAGVALISSDYTTYSDTGPGWNPYGGATPVVWQYTSSPIDTNAFKGTAAQLGELFNGAAPPAPPTNTGDDMPVFSQGMVAAGLNATTVVLPPPCNSGAAGWGSVWFSLGSDMGDAAVRITAFINGAWTDFNLNFVVPASKPRVFPFPNPLPTDVEKISITRLAGSENVPLAYLIEAR